MRKGFTLVELLIVLAIIGVLMGIGIPIYTNQLERAKARAVASNLRMLAQTEANAIMLGDVPDFPAGATLTSVNVNEVVKGLSSSEYALEVSSNNGIFEVYAYYLLDDPASDLIKDSLSGCDEEEYASNTSTYPACVMKDIRTY